MVRKKAYFLKERIKLKRKWKVLFKNLPEENAQPRVLHLKEYTSKMKEKNEEKIKL